MAEINRRIDLTASGKVGPAAMSEDPPAELTLGQAAEQLGCETEVVFDLVRTHGLPLRCSPRTGMVLDEVHLETLRSVSQ